MKKNRQIRSEFLWLKKKRVAIENSRLLSWLFFCLQFLSFVPFACWFIGNLRCTVYSNFLFNNTVIVICESIYCTTGGPRRRVSRIFRDIVCVDALSGYGVLWLSSHGSRLRFSIGTCCSCDERGLMVDPLKLFWVITNSTYLGTSSDTLSISLIIVICLLRYKITHDTLAKPSGKNRGNEIRIEPGKSHGKVSLAIKRYEGFVSSNTIYQDFASRTRETSSILRKFNEF